MAKINKILLSFNGGEISPKMDSRTDQNKYNSGAKTMENFYPLIYGGATRRPGLEYIATQNDVGAKALCVDFEHSVDDTYNLVFENQLIRMFKDGDRVMNVSVDITGVTTPSGNPLVVTTSASHNYATGDTVRFADISGVVGDSTTPGLNYNGNDSTEYAITVLTGTTFSLDGTDGDDYTSYSALGSVASIVEVVSPYLTADLFQLKFEQSADVMFITHPDYEPRRLSRSSNTSWDLSVSSLEDGPFRTQNIDTTNTITASGTTGTVTLTASDPIFVDGTTAGHEPSGALATSKSQTGALFRLVQAAAVSNVGETLDSAVLNAVTTALLIPKGVTWDFSTRGTWGTGGPSTIVLERTYDGGTTYETVHSVTSLADKNALTSGTEDNDEASYRARVSVAGGTGTATIQLSIRDTSRAGVVQITAVNSTTSAVGTVVTTLASTDPTHRWSEGSFSNYRGWPIDVTISPEERLTFVGNKSEPLTQWGSVINDFVDFKEGTDDDDAIIFTLIGTGQQNRIRWVVSKDTLVIGTVGGEHLLGASKDDEALTPTNVRARLQTTYGSEDIAAIPVNQAVLFIQRGGKKIREFLYNFEQDSHKADDLTTFADHITGDGIVDTAYQRTPDPRLWCVRSDGQMAVLTYERNQNVLSWYRYVTDGEFESVSVIYGGAGNEDEVWVTVKRIIDGTTKRYIERFSQQEFDQVDEAQMLDSAKVNVSGSVSGTLILASDTVRFGAGTFGSSLFGGTA